MRFSIKIPDGPSLAIQKLTDAGFEAGIVGGCVRDSVLGKSPHDWDICTSATPDEIQSVFQGFHVLAIGLKHGTITVVIHSENVEITTYRLDGVYSDHRRPDHVAFTRNLRDDLSRRDFTLNALFYHPDSGLIDPFDGMDDIARRRIRCVGDADKRFQEDALRILRAIRFASQLGFQTEPVTRAALFRNKPLLAYVSQERITSEFTKALAGSAVRKVFAEYADILTFILPEIQLMLGFEQHNPYHIYDVWQHTLAALAQVDGFLLRLAILFHDIGKPSCFQMDAHQIGHFYGHAAVSAQIASKAFRRMKLTGVEGITKQDLKDCVTLIRLHDAKIEPTPKAVRRILFKLDGNPVQLYRLFAIQRADILAQSPEYTKSRLETLKAVQTVFEEILAQNECFSLHDLAVHGKDLLAAGVPAGPEIGRLLNMLLQAVLNGDLPNQQDLLLAAAKRAYVKDQL